VTDPAPVRQTTILIVDDDLNYVEDLKILLSERYEVIHLSSLLEFNTTLKKYQPEIILLDIHLDGSESGLEVLDKLKREKNSASVLMISDHPSLDLVVQSMNMGAAGFVNKSTNITDLIRMVHGLVSSLHDRS